MRGAALTVGLVAGLVLGVTSAPATAQTRSFADVRGDASASIDVTKVKVANTRRAVVVRVRGPRLRARDVQRVGVRIRTRAAERPTFRVRQVWRHRSGWGPVVVTRSGKKVVCGGARVRLGRGTATIRVPQRCLGGGKRAVRVGGSLTYRKVPGPNGEVTSDQVLPDRFPTGNLSPWVRYR